METAATWKSTSARHVAPPPGFLGENTAIVFTDMVGSTDLAQAMGDSWSDILTHHHVTVRRHFDGNGAFEAGNQGDGFLFMFQNIDAALRAAVGAIDAFASAESDINIRVGIHWGSVGFTSGVGFFGIALHRAARISAAAGAGQILLSGAAAEAASTQMPHATTTVDHGYFWLRSLNRPERMVELLLEGQEPQAPSAHAIASQELPNFATDLFGRQHLLGHIIDTANNSNGSITTLCGLGGVGKTRLAVEILRRNTARPGIFVDLSQVDAANQVIPEIARSVGLEYTSDLGVDAIAAELHRDRSLLVIDNLEQIIDAAPEIGALARLAPKATVIATSRLPLRLSNETVINIEPLPTATNIDTGSKPCDRLFMQLAGIDEPTQAQRDTVASICRLLDGLPLAIELAAGRVDLLGLDEVARQLTSSLKLLVGGRRDAPERHQSLTSTVLWSYDLLTEPAKVLFCELSQFPAGATLLGLQSVLSLELEQAAELLAELVEHRLVRRTEGVVPRFTMLRVIREVAADELDDRGGVHDTRVRVARFLRSSARDSAMQLGSSAEKDNYVAVLGELENFRNLFEWAEDDDEIIDDALASASHLLMFWWHDHLVEGLAALGRLADLPAAESSRQYARALVTMSILSSYGGAPGDRAKLVERTVAAARKGDRPGATLCTALQQLALSQAAHDQGDLAIATADEVVAVAANLDDFGRSMQLVGLGPVFMHQNEIERAEVCFMQAVTVFDKLGPSWLAAAPIARLGECALRRGDLVAANEYAVDGVDRWAQSPGVNGRSRAWAGLARVRWCEGNQVEARSVAKDAATSAVEFSAIGDLPWALPVAAAAAAADGRFEDAQQLFGATAQLGRSFGQPVLGVMRYDLAGDVQATAAALGADAAAAQRAMGETLSIPQILRLVNEL